MKKWIGLLLWAAWLLPAALGFAGSIEHLTTPSADTEALLRSLCPDGQVLDGYLYHRDDDLDIGQVILRDGSGYLLVTLSGNENNRKAAAVRDALRQDEVPQLWSQAASEAWPGDCLDDWGAGELFEIIYPDARYSWQLSGDEWKLDLVRLPVANVVVSDDRLLWNDETIFNTQPVTLAEFREKDFPLSLEQARSLALTAEAVAGSRAVIRSGLDTEFSPGTPLYASPSSLSPELARYFDGVEGTVTDAGSGYVRVTVGDLTGWVSRENVLTGEVLSEAECTGGQPARIMACGTTRYVTLYRTADTQIPVARLEKGVSIRVMGLPSGGEWLHIVLQDGTMGYLRLQDACPATGNRLLYVLNDKPENLLHLRREASSSSESLGCYFTGTQVTGLFSYQDVSGWTRVGLLETAGWMRSRYLSSEAPTVIPPVTRTADKPMKLYFSASEASAVLSQVPAGTAVELTGTLGYWGRVRLSSGEHGWLLLQGLTEVPSSAVSGSFPLRTSCSLVSSDGQVIGIVAEGTLFHISGGRPWTEWTGWGGILVLAGMETVWGQTEDGLSGYLPAEVIDFGWDEKPEVDL